MIYLEQGFDISEIVSNSNSDDRYELVKSCVISEGLGHFQDIIVENLKADSDLGRRLKEDLIEDYKEDMQLLNEERKNFGEAMGEMQEAMKKAKAAYDQMKEITGG